MAKAKTVQNNDVAIKITAPNFQHIRVRLVGTAPLMQARFSAKSMQAMMAKHAMGETEGRAKKIPKAARNFDQDFKDAMHISTDGWAGVPAAAIRNACIAAIRMVPDLKMTHAKMSLFVVADGNDEVDGAPLVKLIAPKPERVDMATRNATGVADIRVRPMWRKWHIDVTVRFDADQFDETSVVNLLLRAGEQCGIGEGRPFSKSSNGLGYGTFRVESVK